MKTRRFRLKYSAPMNSDRWKCRWINCVHGMGLAGNGNCSGLGEWWNKDCLGFMTEFGAAEEYIEYQAKELAELRQAVAWYFECFGLTDYDGLVSMSGMGGVELYKILEHAEQQLREMIGGEASE